MDNFFQPAPINSGPGHLDRLLATWFESNISLAQVAQNLCITFTSLLEYVGRPEVRQAIQQARQLMHERYSDTGLELLHEAAQDFRALKGLPENPTPADKDRQRATLNGMRQVSALLAGLTPRRATWPRAPRTSDTAPHHAAPYDPSALDRSLDHSTTPPLPEDPQDPPPTRPRGTRAKSAPTADATTPTPKKTYPPVQVVNYLANSTPEPTAPAQPAQQSTAPAAPSAPDPALCHSTTSPLLHPTTSPLLLPFPQPPRARSPSQAA